MTLGGPRQRHAADQVHPGRLRIRTRPDHNDQFGRKGQNCYVRFVPISDINVGIVVYSWKCYQFVCVYSFIFLE